jgi:tRNA pseudouridine55 synthase
VVAKVRGVIKSYTGFKTKVGHSGTLDPLATGLLIIAIGSYTKKLPDLINNDKSYDVTVCLGKISTTGDGEGEITVKSSKKPSIEQLTQTIAKFIGNIEQTPPKYSAIKINGHRAYDLARAGNDFEIKARKIIVNSIKLISYKYPLAELSADVSSGTYIRTLTEDIGNELDCGAYTKKLRRTKIGDYKIKDAISIDNLDYKKIAAKLFTLDK